MWSCQAPPSQTLPLSLHGLFADHMVLQRRQPIVFWGQATPRSQVTITFDGDRVETTTQGDSSWRVRFEPREAGGPFQVQIEHHDSVSLLRDVMVGDLWLCSGQSNMAWSLDRLGLADTSLATVDLPELRVFNVRETGAFRPQADLPLAPDTAMYEQQWLRVTSDSVRYFSAVGYYFGREIHRETGVPIGLIGANWGGTVVEAWTSLETMATVDDFREEVQLMQSMDLDVDVADLDQTFLDWQRRVMHTGPGMAAQWYLPETDLSEWDTCTVPSRFAAISPELADWDGAVWFRTQFDLPAAWQQQDLEIWLGKIDDHDQAWLNGVSLGETLLKRSWSGYVAPDSLLRAEGNVLVVRVFDVEGEGGFTGNPGDFDYYPKGDRSERRSTAGTWHYRPGRPLPDADRLPHFPPLEPGGFKPTFPTLEVERRIKLIRS
jgi:sialate O-acetylesterase